MTNKFKSSWTVAPRSPSENWKRGVVFEFDMLPDEIDSFGIALIERFPGGLIYSLARSEGTNPKTAHLSPRLHGQITSSLLEAGRIANTAYAFFRQPWPEDNASGDIDRLLSYRDASVFCGHDSFRRIGRCLQISWWTGFSPLIRKRIQMNRNGQSTSCSFEFVQSAVMVNSIYDREDQEVTSFLAEVEKLLCAITSGDFASYDPCSDEVINSSRYNASQRRSAGIVRYAALRERTYFDFCHRQGRPPEVMGVRPELRAKLRAEAGLPID